jgi:hypothetical protein
LVSTAVTTSSKPDTATDLPGNTFAGKHICRETWGPATSLAFVLFGAGAADIGRLAIQAPVWRLLILKEIKLPAGMLLY